MRAANADSISAIGDITDFGATFPVELPLERYCEVLAERPDYYVGLGHLELRLLDKKTGKTLKDISR
jgi:hypothetical protein